ncbi:MAG: hypothetical protein NWE92_10975 [Candidatus Bathyarchaeota archaeon]|nr:hypothetical protein [Candidatus Bathyarchaeota archaeon]
MNRQICWLVLLMICASMPLVAFPVTAQVTASQATESLSAADSAISHAYQALSDAESAGANVSTITLQLNTAATYLAEAQNAYRTGDFEVSITKSNDALAIVNQVEEEALALKSSATAANATNAQLSVIYSVAGIAIFLVSLFIIWRNVKRRHINKILRLRPVQFFL